MFIKLLFIFLCCVYSVFAISTFFEKGQRSELFELSDNNMPNLKIYMPEEEFNIMKKAADMNDNINDYNSYEKDVTTNAIEKVTKYIDNIKNINFKEVYPGYDFDKILPELKIGEDGYPTYNVYEVLNGFDFYPENSNDLLPNELSNYVIESNKDFNLFRITEICSTLKMSDFFDEEEINKLFNLEELYNMYDAIEEELSTEIPTDSSNDGISDFLNSLEFKTKNATMIFELDGKQELFDKVTFKLGGKFSRFYSRPAYNLKIRGKKDLYGYSQFKLRADCNDPTIMRTKLQSDIHNRLGLKSCSSAYVELYINNEFMGLYLLNDAYKLSWIEKVYGEKATTHLYKCESIPDLLPEFEDGCTNENEGVIDKTEWINFLKAVEKAKSAVDLEDIFEIDYFLYEMALEYLTGAWDHIQNKHNYYMYKQPNGKWIYLSHDFDHDFGHIDFGYLDAPITRTFEKSKIHLLDILIFNDSTRFVKILDDVVRKVFNPATLYQHIDEIKEYIKPHVLLSKTPNAEGEYPGKLNYLSGDFFTFEQWDAYSEFTNGISDRNSYGLKYWVLMKYRFVCDYYHLECDSIYLDENFQYPVVEELNHLYTLEPYDVYAETPTEALLEDSIIIPVETPTIIPTEISYPFQTETSKETNQSLENIILTNEETVYEVDLPTSIENDDESDDEEEYDISTNIYIPTETIKTLTKTKMIIYTTITN